MTSASSMTKPESSEATRQGASPTAQSTSAIAPQERHTTWWWLSADAGLVARDRARRLDAAHEPGVGERAQHVVDGLVGDLARRRRAPRSMTVSVSACGLGGHGLEDREARAGDPQPGLAQQLVGVGRRGHAPTLAPFWNESENSAACRGCAMGSDDPAGSLRPTRRDGRRAPDAGCGSPNAGTAAEGEFEDYLADHPVDGFEAVDVGGSNVLPFSGTLEVTMRAVDPRDADRDLPEKMSVGADRVCRFDPEPDVSVAFSVAVGEHVVPLACPQTDPASRLTEQAALLGELVALPGLAGIDVDVPTARTDARSTPWPHRRRTRTASPPPSRRPWGGTPAPAPTTPRTSA